MALHSGMHVLLLWRSKRLKCFIFSTSGLYSWSLTRSFAHTAVQLTCKVLSYQYPGNFGMWSGTRDGLCKPLITIRVKLCITTEEWPLYCQVQQSIYETINNGSHAFISCILRRHWWRRKFLLEVLAQVHRNSALCCSCSAKTHRGIFTTGPASLLADWF